MNKKTTVGKILLERVKNTPRMPAYSFIENHKWVTLTWFDFKKRVQNVCFALLNLGVKKGDKIAFLSNSRIEQIISDTATACIGAINVAIFPRMRAKECSEILNHSEAAFLFVEDGYQIKKIYNHYKQLKHVNYIALFTRDNYITHFGTFDKFHTSLIHFRDLCDVGENELNNTDEEFERIINQVLPEDLYSISYSSQTGANPKGVEVTYEMVFSSVPEIVKIFNFKIYDVAQPTLPRASRLGSLEFVLSIFVGWHSYVLGEEEKKKGFSPKEKPTVLFCRTLSLEDAYHDIRALVDEKHPIRRMFLEKIIKMGSRIKVTFSQKKFLIIVNMIVYYFVKNLFIISFLKYFDRRLKFIIVEGGFANPKLIEFYSALGIQIINTYGLKEFFGFVAATKLERFSTDKKIMFLKDVSCRVNENSEIFLKGSGLFSNYYKDLERTNNAFNEGWFNTGDLGLFENEQLDLFGRFDSKIALTNGTIVYPEKLETILSFGRFINQVLIYGEKKPYLTAIMTLNRKMVIKYARVNGIYFSDYRSLCENELIKELIERRIKSVNSKLEECEKIKKYYIFDTELSIDEGELSPSYKINRRFCYDKYKKVFEGLYGANI